MVQQQSFLRSSISAAGSGALLGRTVLSRGFFASNVIPIIDKETLKKRIEAASLQPYLLIDVREPHELVHGTIPSSVNIPLRDLPVAFGLRPGEFQRKYGVAKPNPETEVIFSCRAGPRAMQAAQWLNSAGWEKTICYYGSWIDWSGKSYDL